MNRTRTLRLAEMTLWLAGLILLGVASASTFSRWHYQQQQERALFRPSTFDVRPSEPDRAPKVERRTSNVGGFAPKVERRTSNVDIKPAAQLPAPKKQAATADPLAFGRIEIPRLGVRAIVKDGADEKTLARAVGRVPNSGRPGQEGNMVLAGHRDTFFRPLRNIKVKDRI